jgi:hypothetical protein
VCYKCLLGGCRVHSDDAIDVDNVAHNYVEALLRECDRVQKAFHDTLQTTAEAQAAATTADIRQMAVELQEQLQKTVDAQLAAATADIHATAALLQQQGDVVIEAERQRVRGSLDRLQGRVQDALPCSDDMRALMNVLCSECEPWFSVDVQEHRLKRGFESSGTALVFKNATEAYLESNLHPHRLSMSRKDLPAAQSSLLLSHDDDDDDVDSQPPESSPSVEIQSILHHENKSIDRMFPIQAGASSTFGQLKERIEQETGISRHRLILKPFFCPRGYRSDNDQLSNMVTDGWNDFYKVHVFLDKTIHIE